MDQLNREIKKKFQNMYVGNFFIIGFRMYMYLQLQCKLNFIYFLFFKYRYVNKIIINYVIFFLLWGCKLVIYMYMNFLNVLIEVWSMQMINI